MRARFLVSAAMCAALLTGCGGQRGGYSGPQDSGYTSTESTDAFSDEEIAAMPRQLRERYADNGLSPVHRVAEMPVSTFGVDVDTAAYSNTRRFLTQGQMPPRDAVRSEELINYFRYDYPLPENRDPPFSVTTDVAQTPWNPATRLVRIGLRGYDLSYRERPPANLVFLVDVSGSMDEPDKLPLVKRALAMVADNMRPRDCVSIVVYAGAAGIVLDPSSNPNEVRAALDDLQAGGSTAGGEGIALAYATARASFLRGGINRVILATDGDLNVGITDQRALEQLIVSNRYSGITLTTLGFGQGNLNDAMMEQIADKGNGNYAYIDSDTEARKALDDELSSTLFTIASDVKVQVEFNPDQVSEYRLIGYENRALKEEDFANDQVDAGDIGAGHQVTAIYEVVPKGAKGWLAGRRYAGNKPADMPSFQGGGSEAAYVKLRYKLPGSTVSKEISQPIATNLLDRAPMPSGDLAFAVAVAGFAQKLRGDPLLGNWGYPEIRRLAGTQWGFSQQAWLRQEFLKLVSIAETRSGEGFHPVDDTRDD